MFLAVWAKKIELDFHAGRDEFFNLKGDGAEDVAGFLMFAGHLQFGGPAAGGKVIRELYVEGGQRRRRRG